MSAPAKQANHEKAPICAAFVKQMRELFGEDVRVLWVKEGGFEMGEVPEDKRDNRQAG